MEDVYPQWWAVATAAHKHSLRALGIRTTRDLLVQAGGAVDDDGVRVTVPKLLQFCKTRLCLTVDLPRAATEEPHLTHRDGLLVWHNVWRGPFPKWWNVRTHRQRLILWRRAILTTQDLLLRAGGTAYDSRITVSFANLFAFCNEHVEHLHLDVVRAEDERGVSVSGNRGQKYITWTPLDESLDDPEPSAPTHAREEVEVEEVEEEEEVALPPPPPPPVPCLAEVLPEAVCPLTLELFVDPVVAADGHTYERASIEEWFAKQCTSPLTGAPLPHRFLVSNVALRALLRRLTS